MLLDRYRSSEQRNDRLHETIKSNFQSVNLIDRSTLVYQYIGPKALPGFASSAWVFQPGPSGRPGGSSRAPPAGRFLKFLWEIVSALEFLMIFNENRQLGAARNI